MPNLIPERPIYKRERLLIGFPVLALFALLFATRLLDRWIHLPFDILWIKLVAELVVFLLPTVIFLMMRGAGYSRILRLRMPAPTHIPLMIAAFFALITGSILLSILCGGIGSLGNSATIYETAPAPNWFYGIAMSVVLAVLPAVLEEFFFRGLVVAEYERRGAIRAVLMSALFFSFCHFDWRNLPVYLFSGVLFALVLLATDSLFATIILHASYNLVSLLGQRYLNALYDITGSMEIFLFILIITLLLSGVILFRAAARIYRAREQSGLEEPRRDVPWNVQFYTILDALRDPPIILCAIVAVLGFFLL